ncbi:efflux RND transporter periplasmic adaptor subunit [Rugamonas apoptosis]|uniref:Efflux RND transporter periplasmic adaptor subunit n=1 Tax=Rugamonas apoptosis TaxID=2758570 RepID=A0A7W2FB32_9BURK|nr:efflux RND transporter periplasmic adaptor subunit [Rugamonas apoptosis]MBA5688314.1 efflux RND transporter periplasmic adaptor subunit [Rugamonas apoptosis]
MNKIFNPTVLILALAAAGLSYGGYLLGTRAGTHGMAGAVSASVSASTAASASAQQQATKAASKAAQSGGDKIDPATGRRVLYWHDPMNPGQRFDKPGKSPFMDMELVPVFAEESASTSANAGAASEADTDDGAGVRISPALRQNLGIRYATVRHAEVRDALSLVGTTQFNENATAVVQSRVTGYVEHLHARAPMQAVRRGQPIATLFVPEWLAPQEEYLELRRSGNDALATAARQRMRALSIPDTLVAEAERSGKAQRGYTLTAPASGIVTELGVREGAMASPGMTIAKISAVDKIWLLAEVPESLVPSVSPGMTVNASFAGAPQRSYTGRVRELLPAVNPASRTVQARLELDNRDGALVPGMLMQVRLEGASGQHRLLVPTEAIITSGKRAVVLVADQHKGIRPVVVTPGREHGDDTEIVSGLEAGQQVVASGQFLIDSEANLRAILPKFVPKAEDSMPAKGGMK